MIRVLILAYDFPPYVSVGGLRPNAWFKYLLEYGVQPVVITRQWENKHQNHLDYIAAGWSDSDDILTCDQGTIVRAPYKPNWGNRLMLKYGENKFRLLRKFHSGFLEICQFHLPLGPKRSIYDAAKRYLKSNQIDVIIATGDPFVLFHYAKKLSHEFNIPWVADYRDPWSQHKETERPWIYKKWLRFIEKRTVSNAKMAITVSEFVKMKINSLLPNLPVSLVMNGFDPEPVNAIKDIQQNSESLNIGFVGTLYDWHPIEHFMATFNDYIIARNIEVHLNFYGINRSEWLIHLVQEKFPQIEHLVHVFPKMQNKELLARLAENNVLLLFNYYYYLGTKIFDYLAINRLILLCFGADEKAELLRKRFFSIKEDPNASDQLQAELLNKTQGGIVVEDAEHLKRVLDELYVAFKKEGQIRCDSHDVDQFSRQLQTERLAIFLKKVAND